ncbi:MAG: hypothetical protein FJ191_01685 [Gammaproteobacteria bacterium]|nr:hypothetical protein [Gammaproteobacteria bacterium]
MDITDTHAHGLARSDLRGLRDRCRNARDGAFRKVRETEWIRTGKRARRMLEEVDRGYATTAWARWAATDRHGTYASWLLPNTEGDALAVCCVTLNIPIGAGAVIRQWPWMIIPAHAIARGHQRLRAPDWAEVQSELRVAALHASAVLLVSQALGLSQFAIPAIHGLLIGDVEDEVLRARTFIVPPLSQRWGSVLDAWLRFEHGGCPAWTEAIEQIALDRETAELQPALVALAGELDRFEFLRREHEPGPDVVGDLWEAARQQADRDPSF